MMNFFRRKVKASAIPSPFSKEDIRIESSTCTGERIIGFYDKNSHKLQNSELIKSDEDIHKFYQKYGVEHK